MISRFERAGVRLVILSALCRVLALKERLAHAAHELFFLGGGALLVFGSTDDGEGLLLAFRDEFRDDVEHVIVPFCRFCR